VTKLKWILDSVHLIDRWKVGAERTIGSEIVLDAPDGTSRDEAQVDA
jgi:hypothetical protein